MSSKAMGQISFDPQTINGRKDHFMEYEGRPYRFREFMEAETPGLDDTLTTEDLMFLMPEVLNRNVITLAEDARIGRKLIDTMRINSESESFLKEYGFEAFEVAEGGEVPLGKPRWEKLLLTVMKVGVRPQLTYEAMADNKFGVLQRNVNQATLAMTRFEDAHIMDVLNNGVPDGTTWVGTNEPDHSIPADASELTWDNLATAYTLIIREKLTPTDIVCHPYQMYQFLQMKQFRAVIAVGATPAAEVQPQFGMWNNRMEAMYGSGRIGRILGCNVWFTNNQPEGEILMLDRNNYGILAERRPLLVESADDIIHQMHTVVFTQRYCAGVLNNDGASKITGLLTSLDVS